MNLKLKYAFQELISTKAFPRLMYCFRACFERFGWFE